MYQFRLDDRHVHRSLFHSLRVQCVFALLSAVALPLAALVALRGESVIALPSTSITLWWAGLASLLTLLALRQIGGYFGLVLSKWILPIYASSIGLLGCIPIFLRLPYSTILLALCIASSLVSFYILALLMARARRAVCFVVPVGRGADFETNDQLRTIALDYPALPGIKKAIVVADMHASLGSEWERLLTEAALEGHPVYHVTQLREALTGKVQFDHLSENSFGALVPMLAYKKVKRAIDLVSALVALPLLFPFLVGIGLAIKLDSPGPAVFRQRRVGDGGRLFEIYKFRTMTVVQNGEDVTASVTADDDSRITRLGHFLRRTRLDELPQVFNIIKGQMSWIGPRPEASALSNRYAIEIPNYRYRHLVRPGITGWAQVHQGHVTSVHDVTDKLCYDFYYVKNISLWLDVVIALRTVKVLVTGFGAR